MLLLFSTERKYTTEADQMNGMVGAKWRYDMAVLYTFLILRLYFGD